MKKKYKIIIIIFLLLTLLILLAFLGAFCSTNIIKSIFRNINSQQSGPAVNFTVEVFISEIFNENKLYPIERLNSLKLNNKHVADLVNILIIKNKLEESLATSGTLPNDLYSEWPGAPLNIAGKKYYYHLITKNWVLVASLEQEGNFSKVDFENREDKLFQVKGQELFIVFPIIARK